MLIAEKTSDKLQSNILDSAVPADTPMKEWLIEYVGRKFQSEAARFKADTGKEFDWDGDVTVEMIVELMAKEFPEFIMALAEENFIRGYKQAFFDIEMGQELAAASSEDE
jgi:hypothetical protein|tara:strand:- start:121 stop:450 length:330 start_codon:yes stop_codon:yes gene_type:complete